MPLSCLGRKAELRTSLVVQWLRLHASNAGGVGLIPGRGTKIPHATQCSEMESKVQMSLNRISASSLLAFGKDLTVPLYPTLHHPVVFLCLHSHLSGSAGIGTFGLASGWCPPSEMARKYLSGCPKTSGTERGHSSLLRAWQAPSPLFPPPTPLPLGGSITASLLFFPLRWDRICPERSGPG